MRNASLIRFMFLGLSPLYDQLSRVLFPKALPFCIFLLECHMMEGIISILQMRVVRPRSQAPNLENQTDPSGLG